VVPPRVRLMRGGRVEDNDQVQTDLALISSLPHHDLGAGLIAQVQLELGQEQGIQRLNADWSGEWYGWTELIGAVSELEMERTKCVAECEAAAVGCARQAAELSELTGVLDDNFLEQATALVQAKLRQFYILSDRNQAIPGRTDAQRCRELEAGHGLCRRRGDVWGRNDCCADSLLQLLIEHGVLARTIDAVQRNEACLANRNALCNGPAALRPRSYDGVEVWDAYLEVDRHAEAIVRFFLHRFKDEASDVPAAGFDIIVYTRFDTDDGRRPPVRVRVCATPGSNGEPLRLCMYNTSGGGIIGYHYDPMWRDSLVDGCLSSKREPPVIEGIDTASGQEAEATRIRRWVEQGDFEAAEELMDDPSLLEAKRQSLDSAEYAGASAAGTQDRSSAQRRRVGASLFLDRQLRRGFTDRGDLDFELPRAVGGAAQSAAECGVVNVSGRRGSMEVDSEDELVRALGAVVLSDGEVGDVDVPARVRRVVRRSASDVSRGDVDEVLAARMARSMPRAEGILQASVSVGTALVRPDGTSALGGDGAGASAEAVLECGGMSRCDAASIASSVSRAVEPLRRDSPRVVSVSIGEYGPALGLRRSARIDARTRAASVGPCVRVPAVVPSPPAGRSRGRGRGMGKGVEKRGRG
jgi:hypothetical protein